MSKTFRGSDTADERERAAYLSEQAKAEERLAREATEAPEDVPAEVAEAEQEKPARKSPAGRPGKKGVKKGK